MIVLVHFVFRVIGTDNPVHVVGIAAEANFLGKDVQVRRVDIA